MPQRADPLVAGLISHINQSLAYHLLRLLLMETWKMQLTTNYELICAVRQIIRRPGGMVMLQQAAKGRKAKRKNPSAVRRNSNCYTLTSTNNVPHY